MITLSGIQCRMARAALGWKTSELAERVPVSTATIVRLEGGAKSLNAGTLKVIRLTFEAAGVEFIDSDGKTGAVVAVEGV